MISHPARGEASDAAMTRVCSNFRESASACRSVERLEDAARELPGTVQIGSELASK